MKVAVSRARAFVRPPSSESRSGGFERRDELEGASGSVVALAGARGVDASSVPVDEDAPRGRLSVVGDDEGSQGAFALFDFVGTGAVKKVVS